MTERDRIEMEGVVVAIAKDRFTVKINDNYTVVCTLSGKIRQNAVKIILNDMVKVEISPYEPTKGRIVFRMK